MTALICTWGRVMDTESERAVENGVMAKLSRIIIVVIFPLFASLTFYAFTQKMDNIDFKINSVSGKIDYTIEQNRESEKRINGIENNMGRIDERVTQLERRVK